MASPRKIASNLLWTPQGIVRNPLVEVADDGHVVAVTSCCDPDRVPCTEFYAGMLVSGFPADWRDTFVRLQADGAPLDEQLRGMNPASGGVLVVLSGLDYDRLCLTPQSQIRKL